MTASVADVLLMPGVREIVIRRLPLERRKQLLRGLARDCWDMSSETVEVLLTAYAHDSMTGPALRAAWLEYRARLELADDVTDGRLDYRVINDELLCCERTSAAIEIAHQDAEEALDVLAGGRPMRETS